MIVEVWFLIPDFNSNFHLIAGAIDVIWNRGGHLGTLYERAALWMLHLRIGDIKENVV